MAVHITRDPDSREVLSEDEQEPYGTKTRSTVPGRREAVRNAGTSAHRRSVVRPVSVRWRH
ncbi:MULTISPECIES: hypothetical protein [unclassified Streptomyces]|uniref:hypothetical protein n=1 Tax=unclassified Streptomyces TaxID=2593676 RepID=UPI00343F753C